VNCPSCGEPMLVIGGRFTCLTCGWVTTVDPTVLAEALFCTDLQPLDYPNGSGVRFATSDTLTELGEAECSARLAQAAGDHPEATAERMVWALFTVRWAFAPARV